MFSTLEQPGIGSYLVPASPLDFTAAGRAARRAARRCSASTPRRSSPTCSGSARPRSAGCSTRDGRRRRRPRLVPLRERRSNAIADGAKSVRRTKAERVGRAPLAVHPGVLPFDRERALVADPVERAEHRLEVDVAVAGGDEVPAAAGRRRSRGARRGSSERPSSRSLESLTWTWKMRSPNSSMKAAESRNWCSRWLGSKLIPNPGGRRSPPSALRVVEEVVGDLGGVDLEREAHALGLEDVDDRAPALGEHPRSRARSRRSRWAGTSRGGARSASR